MTIPTTSAVAPPNAAKSAATRRARTLGVATSLAVHAALLLGLLCAAQGDLIATDEGAADLGEVTVTLVRPRYVAAPSDAAQPGRQLTPLFARYDNGQPPIVLPDRTKPRGLNSLFRRLTSGETPPTQAAPETAAETRIPIPPANTAGQDDRDARTRGETGKSTGADAAKPGSVGGLWGVVQPCWKKLGKSSTRPVTLEVSLDDRGQLSVAPKVLRPVGNRVDEEQLRAEALAITALSACMPRSAPRWGGRVYRLEFSTVN